MSSCRRLPLAAALAALAPPAGAQHADLEEILINATPMRSTAMDLAQSAAVLSGDDLVLALSSSIGESRAGLPGVTASYFGPRASRPVIRGLLGERVLMLSNGVSALDVSNLSPDHSVAVEDVLADQVEVLKGPATLLYGSGAVGGVVNVVDGRIPRLAEPGLSGAHYRVPESQIFDRMQLKICYYLEVFEKEITDLAKRELLRSILSRASAAGPVIIIQGRTYVNFASNDYLGLANHPEVVRAAGAALKDYGFGSGASRLLAGGTVLHDRLERHIAGFKQTEAARLFSCGYAANTGVIPSLSAEGDIIYSDELNHASIIDGCRLSRAQTVIYRHGDVAHLERF